MRWGAAGEILPGDGRRELEREGKSAMSATDHYDAIVIGTGQGGKPLGGALARAGWKTAIVERDHVGGSCVNVGCTPTKTMVASARIAYLARRGNEYGVNMGPVSVDQQRVRARKRAIVESFRGGSQKGLEKLDNLSLVMGEASFTGAHAIRVRLGDGGTRSLVSERIFINTGARPAIPDVPGLDSVSYLDSTSIMELEDTPEHLVVLGGGYIGLEFGQMFRRFGSRVTIVQRAAQLLPREDTDVADAVCNVLQEDGIDVRLDSVPVRAERHNGRVVVTTRSPESEHLVEGSHLLIAVGRVPNTERLDLEAAGIARDERGFIPVNQRLETSVPGIYALGDVTGGPAFTHISYDDYRILTENLLNGGGATTDGRLVPYTVFIDPQLGRVGLSEREARQRSVDYRVATMPMARVARALEMDEARGFMKVLIEPASDRILGCAILGIEGGEVMSMVQIAMMGNLPYTALRDGIFAHPTLAESLNNLFLRLDV
jgi:pyruvate/2-oxoglutarate dehydrogenase complex dihydrolipoamide dehydrogenase (E3) component